MLYIWRAESEYIYRSSEKRLMQHKTIISCESADKMRWQQFDQVKRPIFIKLLAMSQPLEWYVWWGLTQKIAHLMVSSDSFLVWTEFLLNNWQAKIFLLSLFFFTKKGSRSFYPTSLGKQTKFLLQARKTHEHTPSAKMREQLFVAWIICNRFF